MCVTCSWISPRATVLDAAVPPVHQEVLRIPAASKNYWTSPPRRAETFPSPHLSLFMFKAVPLITQQGLLTYLITSVASFNSDNLWQVLVSSSAQVKEAQDWPACSVLNAITPTKSIWKEKILHGCIVKLGNVMWEPPWKHRKLA